MTWSVRASVGQCVIISLETEKVRFLAPIKVLVVFWAFQNYRHGSLSIIHFSLTPSYPYTLGPYRHICNIVPHCQVFFDFRFV